MKKEIFTGACTALVTPMNENGVDYEAFGRLIDWQIEEGIDALLIAGTSGESSTLDDDEHKQVLEFAVKRINHRVPAIAGTGSNDTAYACQLTKHACEIGYDACLVVTPYYNKATQNGLIAMFKKIADASTKPIILYNVPSRTGINIEPSTFAALKDYPNIEAIKEASGNIGKVVDTFALVGDDLTVYSGNDDQIVPLLSMGGKGVISVLSNCCPKETSQMVHDYLNGDVQKAAQAQLKYLPLIHALFSEVNPIPAKCAMAKMGYGENFVRLPLTPMEEAHQEVLFAEMKKLGLIEE